MRNGFMKWILVVASLALVMGLAGCQTTEKTDAVTPAGAESSAVVETIANKAIEEGAKVNYVNAEELKAQLDQVVIVDARADKEYNAGHIPGAINITWQMLSNMTPKQSEAGWGVVLGKDELAARLGSFGIDGSKSIVVYNDPKGLGEEGRVLWMLRIAGLKDVKMLNGGIPAWNEMGGETTKDATAVTAVNFTIENYDEGRIATTDYIKANLATLKLIDTRSPDEYNGVSNHGENYKGEKALGHIPGALPLQYSELYNIDGTIKSIADIQATMDKLGVSKDDEIVTYCTVGIRSGFTAEILRMAGYEKAKNYNASFSEWAGLGNPYEK